MMSKFLRNIRFALPIRSIVILVVLVFFILLPIICWNLQFSAYFFEGDLNYAAYLKRLDNNRRIAQARTYFSTKKLSFPFVYHNIPSIVTPDQRYPKIAIVIPTTNRDTHKIDAYEPKYLTQSIVSLLQSIDRDVKQHGKRYLNVSITLCNVDNIPERFFEFKSLSKYLETVQIDPVKTKPPNGNCASKFHFVSCLNLTRNRHKTIDKFVIIEDDLLAKKDTFEQLANIFDSLTKRFQSEIPARLGYVQLYFPEKLVRYSIFDSDSLLEIIFVSSGLVFILYLFYFRLHMRSLFFVYNALLIAVLFALSVGFVIAIGRPHWRSVYHSFSKSSMLIEPISKSAAAVLLDREFLNEIVASNNTSQCSVNESKLDFLDAVAGKRNRRILSVNRNVFSHIGLYSAFKKTIVNPHHID